MYIFIFVLFTASALCAIDFICGQKACADRQKTATLILKFKQETVKKKIDDTSIYPFVFCVGAVLAFVGYYVDRYCKHWYEERSIREHNVLTTLRHHYMRIQILHFLLAALVQQDYPAPRYYDETLAAAPAA
jgi:hypothetical protein